MTIRRDSRGRFTSRTYRRRTATTRRMKRHSTRRVASSSSSKGGNSPTRIMTILGIGAAAIFLTQKLTAPKAAIVPQTLVTKATTKNPERLVEV